MAKAKRALLGAAGIMAIDVEGIKMSRE